MILSSPSKKNIDAWLMSEMTAKSGGRFTPSDDYWRPDPTAQAANVASAKCAVIDKVRPWLIAALSYYAMEYSARTLKHLAYILSKCGNSSLDVLDESNVIAVRNILSKSEFAVLRSFLKRWREDYLLEVKPSEAVVDYLYAIKPRNNSPRIKAAQTAIEKLMGLLLDSSQERVSSDYLKRTPFRKVVPIQVLCCHADWF